MRKFARVVAVAVIFFFAAATSDAWAAVEPGSRPDPTVGEANIGQAGTSAAVDPGDTTTINNLAVMPRKTIRGSIQAMGETQLLVLPNRTGTPVAADYGQEPQPTGTGRHLGKGPKAAIWIAAITVTTYWAYKTFSVTRGTD